jgi:quercetin dioxygenase-like cupin family protein
MHTLPAKLFSVLLLCVGQSSVPVGEEPRHQIKFENKYVRVIDAVIAPGDTTLFHTHSRDNVPVCITGGKLRTEVMGGQRTDTTAETGRVTFAKASYTHRITNMNPSQVRFIDAEVLASPGSTASPSSLAAVPDHTLIFENEHVRAYRLILEPGQSTGLHGHALSFLNVVVSPGKVVVEQPGKKSETLDVQPGSFVWYEGPLRHSLKNAGAVRIEAIDIEWK